MVMVAAGKAECRAGQLRHRQFRLVHGRDRASRCERRNVDGDRRPHGQPGRVGEDQRRVAGVRVVDRDRADPLRAVVVVADVVPAEGGLVDQRVIATRRRVYAKYAAAISDDDVPLAQVAVLPASTWI